MQSKLKLCTELGAFLSDQRIQLLEAIATHGSLNAAAKAIPLSYKAAWDALNSMNNLADKPLVLRSTGGKNGGGTQLTPYAQKLISLYKALEQEYQQTLDRLQQTLNETSKETDVVDFRRLMRRVNFRTSARNQLVGKVSSVTHGAVNVIVELKVGEQITLVAAVTKESAYSLELEYGKELIALIKSSQMILQKGNHLRLSANNRLTGMVSHIEPGAVCGEVTLELSGQKSLGVTVTQKSMDELQLRQGDEVKVCFNASAVILCRYGD